MFFYDLDFGPDGKSTDFLAIPMLFYVIVVAGRFDLGTLRQHGWLFDMGETGSHQAWYKFYSYFGALLGSPV